MTILCCLPRMATAAASLFWQPRVPSFCYSRFLSALASDSVWYTQGNVDSSSVTNVLLASCDQRLACCPLGRRVHSLKANFPVLPFSGRGTARLWSVVLLACSIFSQVLAAVHYEISCSYLICAYGPSSDVAGLRRMSMPLGSRYLSYKCNAQHPVCGKLGNWTAYQCISVKSMTRFQTAPSHHRPLSKLRHRCK